MLKMLLSPDGATVEEMVECGITRGAVSAYIDQLVDQKGWDVRKIKCPRSRKINRRHSGGARVVYKVVGKMRWDGTYRPIPRIIKGE